MLNKNSKSTAILLSILIIAGASALFLSKGNAAPVEQVPEKTIMEQIQAGLNVDPVRAGLNVDPAPLDKSVGIDKVLGLLAPPAAITNSTGIDIAAAIEDRVLGNENAPVTIIEYTSLTCSYCALFSTKIMPEIKRTLIDTGKAKLIYRDFPLDSIALKASMMARCVPKDKFFDMIDVLFSNQKRWIRHKDPMVGLAQLGSLAGLDEEAFKKCTENVALETAIVKVYQEAQRKYHINGSPTFIFNDGAAKLVGARSAADFTRIVNKLTRGK